MRGRVAQPAYWVDHGSVDYEIREDVMAWVEQRGAHWRGAVSHRGRRLWVGVRIRQPAGRRRLRRRSGHRSAPGERGSIRQPPGCGWPIGSLGGSRRTMLSRALRRTIAAACGFISRRAGGVCRPERSRRRRCSAGTWRRVGAGSCSPDCAADRYGAPPSTAGSCGRVPQCTEMDISGGAGRDPISRGLHPPLQFCSSLGAHSPLWTLKQDQPPTAFLQVRGRFL